MSNGNICSDDEKCGGLGAMVANSLRHQEERAASAQCAVAAASAVPAPAKATVAPLGASGTKKSPPVAVAERTWLTKRPTSTRRRLFSPLRRLRPLLRPLLLRLLGSAGLQRVHLRRRSPPPSFLLCLLWRWCPCRSTSPSIHAVFSSRS
jgi:hypothetical protein